MTSLIQLKIDKNIKTEADRLFKSLGLDTTTAVRMFLMQAINKQGIPFEVTAKSEDEIYSVNSVKILKERINRLESGLGVSKELINE